jgi:hypothetical protein
MLAILMATVAKKTMVSAVVAFLSFFLSILMFIFP